jgi:membrane dipeptidase
MDRREFSLLLGAVALGALVPRAEGEQAATDTPPASLRADGLYRRALVLDANSGPPYHGKLPLSQAELDMARASGVNVVKLSLGGINEGFEKTVGEIANTMRAIELHPAYFLQVRIPDDMERAKREGKLGIIFSFESAEMLEGEIENFDLFRNLGVRVMQLSYNRKSPFAAGVLEPDAGGLTLLGREAVARMNAIGITVDVSHANAATVSDVLAASIKPVVMTHTGCAAVYAHPRNKTDEQLRALANKGGVAGIYDLPYLTPSPKQPTVDDYMAHMEHALKVAGEDHVGVGSDVELEPFDTTPAAMAEFNKTQEERRKAGLAAPGEDRPLYVIGMNTPRRIEVIADQLLKRGYPMRVAEKVIGANFVRVLRETW